MVPRECITHDLCNRTIRSICTIFCIKHALLFPCSGAQLVSGVIGPLPSPSGAHLLSMPIPRIREVPFAITCQFQFTWCAWIGDGHRVRAWHAKFHPQTCMPMGPRRRTVHVGIQINEREGRAHVFSLLPYDIKGVRESDITKPETGIFSPQTPMADVQAVYLSDWYTITIIQCLKHKRL